MQGQEVNVYNLWRKLVEEEEKIARSELAAVQVRRLIMENFLCLFTNRYFYVFLNRSSKKKSRKMPKPSAKPNSLRQRAPSRCCHYRRRNYNTLYQRSVIKFDDYLNLNALYYLTLFSQLDRTKRIYFCEETEFEDVRDKTKSAEDRSKGRKKDLKSLFQSKSALRKQAGLLSAKQEEGEIKSTGARNDYILNLASSNAHQDRYYKHDLQDTMRALEGDFYERIKSYFVNICKTKIQVLTTSAQGYNGLTEMGRAISRIYNYECYTKVYPSLGQHIK